MPGAIGSTTIVYSAVLALACVLLVAPARGQETAPARARPPPAAAGKSPAEPPSPAASPRVPSASLPPAPPPPPPPPPPPSVGGGSPPADYPFGESQEPLEDLTRWLGGQTDPAGRPCSLYKIVPTGDGIFAACGPAGLWIIRVDEAGKPELIEARNLGGDVVGLFEEGGRVWVKVSRLEAYPVDETARPYQRPVPPPPPGPVAPPPPAPAPPVALPPPIVQAEGRVVDVLPGEVVVSLGTKHGVDVGQRIELSSEVSEVVGGGEKSRRRLPLAVGVVNSVSEGFSRVGLGLNERVPLGATARVTARPLTRSLSAPPRAEGVWELDVMLRPFLALESLGGGFLGAAALGYRFENNLHLEARVDPIGLGDAESEDAVTPVTGLFLFTYDQHLFEIGAGVGGQTVNSVPFDTEVGSGTVLAQALRLGAEDGLHLDVRTEVVLFHSRFSFSSFTGEGQIPVGNGSWLLFRGAGGDAGYGYGELGLRLLLRGNGDAGSTFVTVVAGGAVVFKSEEFRTLDAEAVVRTGNATSTSGPMAGIGATWRF